MSHLLALETRSGPFIWFLSSCNIRMNSSSISKIPHPQRQAISDLLKLGVIMSTTTAPTARRNVLRRISQQHQSFPSASSFERISVTILSSSDVDDFADAHSASISKTLNTTRSDSIDTTMVFAHPASSGTITFPFQSMRLS